MKLLKYIWRNVTRNKLRSLLTILSVGFSLALMTVLYGYLQIQNVVTQEAGKHNRVVVLNKMGFTAPLPIAHVDKIRKMDGIVDASPFAWFGGKYKSEIATFAQFAVEPDSIFNVLSEYNIPEDQVEQFKKVKNGCVIDANLAEAMEWSLGDKIPLEGDIYPVDLELTVVGIFKNSANTGSLYFNWNYLDELLQAGSGFSGNAGSIQVKCADGVETAEMCNEIDAKFVNSENATRTRTEAAFSKMFADMVGDVQLFIRYISLAVVFSLTLVTATAMAMSIRERTTEVAVLKAIGFTKQRVLTMILGESVLIACLGGILGIATGLGMLHMLSTVPIAASMFPFPIWRLVGPWLLGLVGVAGAIGLISGTVPAIWAAGISVVDGLRQVV
jgi:putative ABC transport system permease protein